MLTPALRKLNLTAHIASSAGWFGAVAVFLALAIASLTSPDDQVVKGACFAMSVAGWFVILPLAISSLLTGVVQGLGTSWGLVRYYWVFAKLVLTALATLVLLLKMKLISAVAASAVSFNGDFRQARLELLVHAAGGLVILLTATVLSVFKPWGKTSFGRKAESVGHAREVSASSGITGKLSGARWKILLALVVGAILAGMIALHLLNGGAGMHGGSP